MALSNVSPGASNSLLVSNFANVDFPDDFGPHIMITGVLVSKGSAEHFAKTAFHSGADIIG